MRQEIARIILNKKIKSGYWYSLLQAPLIAREACPGQFINIRLTEDLDPLLRRPISIHGISGANVKIIYEVVGKATGILAQKKAGENLDIIGPLGNGFSYKKQKTDDTRKLLVAGGMGVAPLIFLAERLTEVKSQKSKVKTIVLIGARTKEKLVCVQEFKNLGCDVKIATDDGSAGFKGRVSDLLKSLLSTIDYPVPAGRQGPSSMYVCGPKPMLKAVADISRKYNIVCQLSLEEHMACGIGVCLGCVIKVKSQKSKVKSDFEYKRVCKDGPVFNADDLIWSR